MALGRVTSQRILGSKLLHLQLATGANRMSTVPAARVQLNHRFLSQDKHEPGIDGNALKVFSRKLKRGDWMSTRESRSEFGFRRD